MPFSKFVIADVDEALGAWATLESLAARKVRQTLTDKTSFSGTSAEQWGSEEATLDDALLPALTNVTVYAELIGVVTNFTTTSNLFFAVEISLDGGSTWSTGVTASVGGLSGSGIRVPVGAIHQVTGTVTGDIQARVMSTSLTGASDSRDLLNGAIYMEVTR